MAREASPGPLRYRLWCGGLHKDITEDEIRQAVEPIAEVKAVMLRSSAKDTFCFIQFTNQKDMDKAIEKLDQSAFLGDRVCAQPATADKKKSFPEQRPERQERPPRRQDSRGRGREAPAKGYGRQADAFHEARGTGRSSMRSRTPGRGGDRRDGRRYQESGHSGRAHQEDWRDRDPNGRDGWRAERWRDNRQGQGYQRDSRERDPAPRDAGARSYRDIRDVAPRDGGYRDSGYRGRDARDARDGYRDAGPRRGREHEEYPARGRDRGFGGERYDDRRDVRQTDRDFQERGPPARDVYYRGPPERGRGRDDFDTRDPNKIPIGRHKITVENLPDDMTWVELKDLGKDFGPSVTFAKTYKVKGVYYGMLEFQVRDDAEIAVRELDHRRVQGSSLRLRAYHGDGPGAMG